jgi:hypothetical protein
MGWDAKLTIPTKAKLEDLGIGWVADKLAEKNKLL